MEKFTNQIFLKKIIFKYKFQYFFIIVITVHYALT